MIGFLLGCVALVIALCVLVWLGVIIFWLIVIAVIAGMAICLPLIGIGAASPGYEWLGGLLGLGGSCVFLAVIWHYRPRSEPKAEPKDKLEVLHRQTMEPVAPPRVAIKPLQEKAEKVAPVPPQTRVDGPDADFARAWKQAENLASAHADAIAEASDACGRLLVASDADPFDLTMRDLAFKIRQNLPEFVTLSAQGLSRAEPDQKRIIRDDLVRSLTALGHQSREALAANHLQHDIKREAMSRRFQNDG